MSIISKIAPSSASIQKEYVEKRKRALFANDDQKTEAVKAKIEALLARKNVTADWHETYLRIHRGLQAANLTINLEAGSWFSNENNYDTYAQMYERGIGADGKMVIDDSDKKNPAAARAIVDDLVTIPDEWAGGLFSQRRRLRKALHATGATNASNKELGNPSQAARSPSSLAEAPKGTRPQTRILSRKRNKCLRR